MPLASLLRIPLAKWCPLVDLFGKGNGWLCEGGEDGKRDAHGYYAVVAPWDEREGRCGAADTDGVVGCYYLLCAGEAGCRCAECGDGGCEGCEEEEVRRQHCDA